MKLNITKTILDKLGFTEYWDEDCYWGTRTLIFKNGTTFRIAVFNESNDNSDGYSQNGRYIAKHYSFGGWIALPVKKARDYDLFFLHEMYCCIKNEYPECLEEFVSKCKMLKMQVYIDDYLNKLL